MRKSAVGVSALVGILALVCSACGGGNPAASHDEHHTHTSTSTKSGGLARCTSSQLSISVGESDAGAGHEGAAIVFVNRGTSECSLSGYPGVAALSSSGAAVQQAQRTPNGYLGGLETGSSTPPVVDLQTGTAASALVEGTDVPEGTASSCPTYPALAVTPPTSTRSRRLALSLPGCSPIQIHPVVIGITGST